MEYRVTVVNGRRLSSFAQQNPTYFHEKGTPAALPGVARELWDNARRVAAGYYKGAWDLADVAAWRAVRQRFPHGAGVWFPRNAPEPKVPSIKLPDPAGLIPLGRILEFVVQALPPQLQIYRFANDDLAPVLLWSPSEKMLVVMPALHRLPPRHDTELGDVPELAQLLEQYSWGQAPRGQSMLPVQDHVLHRLGEADTIVYRSGKGTPVRDDPTGVQEYIHQVGDDVVTYAGPDPTDPAVIVFKGGQLDVEMAGIVN